VAREDLLLAPESLETLIGGLRELAVALGPGAAEQVAGVRAQLENAKAARDAGNRDAAVAGILTAMQKIAQLAAALDPREAEAMRAMAAGFESALRRGDAAHAAESVDGMRQRSGAQKKRDDDFKL
jgi:hypothetical protein